MTWFKQLEGDWVLGTCVTHEGTRPFRLNMDTGEVVMGEHVGGAPERSYSAEEKLRITQALRDSCDEPILEVRVNQYLCHECGQWIEAGPRWSLGLCLSCSMDRDSDTFG